MAQQAKSFLQNHEKLNSDPQHSQKGQEKQSVSLIPAVRVRGQTNPRALHSSLPSTNLRATLVRQVYSKCTLPFGVILGALTHPFMSMYYLLI